MRKGLMTGLCSLLLTASAWAQDKPSEAPAMPMTPPPALNDELFQWMVGEWEGWTSSSMGKSQDSQKIEWALDNQFLVIHFTAKSSESNPEAMKAMAEAMKLSEADMKKMMDMAYKGLGTMTISPMTGEVTAMWFDNWRSTYKGIGKREGNVITVNWESPMGSETRTIEKIGSDKMMITFKGKDMTGKDMEGRSEMTRKKMTSKS